jgi:hypothetical protein
MMLYGTVEGEQLAAEGRQMYPGVPAHEGTSAEHSTQRTNGTVLLILLKKNGGPPSVTLRRWAINIG